MPLQSKWCEKALGRTILLANAPGSGKDVVYVLLDELMNIKAKPIDELD
jgi:hypothetical protein